MAADPLGHETEFSYNYLGNKINQTDAEWNVTTFDYNVNGRLTARTNAEGHKTEYDYDYMGNRIRLTDPRGNWTDFSYNQFNELIGITYADSSFEAFVYDDGGLKRQKTTRAGETITYTYDEFGRLTARTYPDSSIADFSYDQLGRMTAASNDNAEYSFSYNDLNQLVEVDFSIGSESYEIAYTHDLVGNKTSIEYPYGGTYTREYDDLNRLDQVKEGAAVLADYTYNDLNQRTRRDYLNSTWTSYSYNDTGWLTDLVNWRTETDVLSSFSYTHDNVGNRTSMTTEDGTHDYGYDKIYELTGVDYPAASSFSDQTFHYDAAWNRTTTVNGGTEDYLSNNLNQYTEVNGVEFDYDLNGNLTTDGIQTYYYDCENQLTKVVRDSDGETLGEYKYDPFGKRIKKITDDSTINYVYDQTSYQVIAEYEDDGGGFELAREFIYGVGIDEPLVMVQDEERYFYYRNGLGSVVGLAYSDGNTVKEYDYAVWGDFSSSGILSGNPYTFTGRRYDPESGLFYYRARYYSAGIGRFLQADPIGYNDWPNLYFYVYNNIINKTDSFGLFWEPHVANIIFEEESWGDWYKLEDSPVDNETAEVPPCNESTNPKTFLRYLDIGFSPKYEETEVDKDEQILSTLGGSKFDWIELETYYQIEIKTFLVKTFKCICKDNEWYWDWESSDFKDYNVRKRQHLHMLHFRWLPEGINPDNLVVYPEMI